MSNNSVQNTDSTNITRKVLHVTYDMRIGGTEMVIKNIIEGNTNQNINMSIYCIEEPIGPWGVDMQNNGITVHSIARSEGFDKNVIKALRSHIKQHKIDILHCHQYTPWVYGTLAALGTQTKIIFTEHGRFYPDSSSWKRRFINPVLSLFTHRITAISKATKQALVDYEFLSAKRIEVIYNGIEGLLVDQEKSAEIKTQLDLNKDDIIFGTIARLDPIKNHAMMLNAFAKLVQNNTNAKLIIIGDGDLMAQIKTQVLALSLQRHVVLTGYINYPKDYLAIFDVFLLSSFSEGTSMTLLEAMSVGKPCVVTDAGGNKEIVADDVTGMVTDNDVAAQFAEAMLALASNTTIAEQYGSAGKDRFEHLFNVSIMNENYAKLYAS